MTSLKNLGIASVAGLALVIGGGAFAANAAAPTASASASASASETSTAHTCTPLQHLRAAWGEVPADLKSDLKALKAMSPGKGRKADAVKIRTKELAGGYGAGVEVRAEWHKANKGMKLRPLPVNLKADLKTLHADSKAAKPAEAKKISDGALAGTYGTTVESFAKAVQSSTAWKDCTPAGS